MGEKNPTYFHPRISMSTPLTDNSCSSAGEEDASHVSSALRTGGHMTTHDVTSDGVGDVVLADVTAINGLGDA